MISIQEYFVIAQVLLKLSSILRELAIVLGAGRDVQFYLHFLIQETPQSVSDRQYLHV